MWKWTILTAELIATREVLAIHSSSQNFLLKLIQFIVRPIKALNIFIITDQLASQLMNLLNTWCQAPTDSCFTTDSD